GKGSNAWKQDREQKPELEDDRCDRPPEKQQRLPQHPLLERRGLMSVRRAEDEAREVGPAKPTIPPDGDLPRAGEEVSEPDDEHHGLEREPVRGPAIGAS